MRLRVEQFVHGWSRQRRREFLDKGGAYEQVEDDGCLFYGFFIVCNCRIDGLP